MTSLLVSLPFSTLINVPPLGPMVLKAHAAREGHDVKILDLNLKYINRFINTEQQDQNINITNDFYARALNHYNSSLNFPEVPSHKVPCCRDIYIGLPFDFSEIENIIEFKKNQTFWESFFKEYVFDKFQKISVLGISIMGPNQVIISLLLAKLCKKLWSKTLVIAGGSHVTLLADRIKNDIRYGKWIDYFLPGQSEEVYAKFLTAVRTKNVFPKEGILQAGDGNYFPCRQLMVKDRLPPKFSQEEIDIYSKEHILFPMQLRRGCAYGRCRYCTFSVIEQFDHGVDVKEIARKQLSALLDVQPKRISLRDSLLELSSLKKFGFLVKEMLPNSIWRASSKINKNFTPQKAKELYDLNMRVIEFGVETIHPHVQLIIDKIEPIQTIDSVLESFLSVGIKVALNLIFGFPGETLQDAEKQLEWFLSWRRKYPESLFGTLNMLGIDYGSQFAKNPDVYGIEVRPLSPWASNYVWNAPAWATDFSKKINISDNLMTNPLLSDKLLFI